MCHPGRPGPHGDGHAGSPGLEAFQRAKSAEARFPDPEVRAPRANQKFLRVKTFALSMMRVKQIHLRLLRGVPYFPYSMA